MIQHNTRRVNEIYAEGVKANLFERGEWLYQTVVLAQDANFVHCITLWEDGLSNGLETIRLHEYYWLAR